MRRVQPYRSARPTRLQPTGRRAGSPILTAPELRDALTCSILPLLAFLHSSDPGGKMSCKGASWHFGLDNLTTCGVTKTGTSMHMVLLTIDAQTGTVHFLDFGQSCRVNNDVAWSEDGQLLAISQTRSLAAHRDTS
ncbi:hypothetical protein WJX73_004133 [Symbiochloris irregularis]|uniref:Anaphase-promoting complex subunit 4 WD40 domain-containing protein n=1 Tax=Symbiochloris irregularis TaxID=706552 RepID=A0AAW1P471_9CHLO